MKLPPASRKPSYTLRLSSFSTPQPGIPNVIAPSASSETRRPLWPSSRYFIGGAPIHVGVERTGYPEREPEWGAMEQPDIVDITGLDEGRAGATARVARAIAAPCAEWGVFHI